MTNKGIRTGSKGLAVGTVVYCAGNRMGRAVVVKCRILRILETPTETGFDCVTALGNGGRIFAKLAELSKNPEGVA